MHFSDFELISTAFAALCFQKTNQNPSATFRHKPHKVSKSFQVSLIPKSPFADLLRRRGGGAPATLPGPDSRRPRRGRPRPRRPSGGGRTSSGASALSEGSLFGTSGKEEGLLIRQRRAVRQGGESARRVMRSEGPPSPVRGRESRGPNAVAAEQVLCLMPTLPAVRSCSSQLLPRQRRSSSTKCGPRVSVWPLPPWQWPSLDSSFQVSCQLVDRRLLLLVAGAYRGSAALGS